MIIMKFKKILTASIAIIILFSLTGCIQLAREDAGENRGQDRLIGVFITTEYLDLFDTENYLKDNIKGNFSGNNIIIDTKNDRYQGRLYATLTTRTLTDEVTGKSFNTKEYVFDSVKGISYFSASVPATLDEVGFTTTGSDEAINDGHTALHYGDDEERTTLEGTIYLSPGQGKGTYYINPVFQSTDGRVYATSGGGYFVGGVQSEGSLYTQTLEETTTMIENHHKKQISISVKISFSVMFSPEQIVLLHMSEDSVLLSRKEYVPGELPKSDTPETGTEYIIVETYKRDDQGNRTVRRLLYDKKDNTIETFYRRDDGICVKQWTQIEWP